MILSRTKQQAYGDIAKVSYNGKNRNWTFEKYMSVHMSAHLVLQEHAEVISGSVKVDDFLKKIMISNKEMAAGKATVLAMTAFRNNFAEASNYLANFVAAQLWGQHNISYMGRGRRRGGHGRGCGECYRG